MKRTLAALAILCFSGTALPCRVLPQALFRDHTILANEATSILLVEATANSRKAGESCQLRVIRTLKGIAPKVRLIACRPPEAGELKTHFTGHSEPVFWQRHGGRLSTNTACMLDPPTFEVGHNYLLLLGIAPHIKQFEEIAGPTDQWLLFIERRISERKP